MDGICCPEYRLRFGVPRVKPGAYAFVIYCCESSPGGRGNLIVNPTRYLLHVRRGGSNGSAATGIGEGWWIAGGMALALVAGGAVLLRRRPGESAHA